MKKTPGFFLILVFLGTGGQSVAQNGTNGFNPRSETYIWPTDASPYLSATFAETRAKHFHAAIDIKTWGQKGYRVFASREGFLHRLSIGPEEYGKVIYLKHDDGSYSLYAHLLAFEERIQGLADSLRFKDYSFELDVRLDTLNIRIEPGELIGYTGASGIGPPHLHFELRTPSQKPFNPMLAGLPVSDTRPPRFASLSVEPLASHSRIEGRNQIYLRRPVVRSDLYDFGKINVQGPAGLGVDVFDLADNVTNAYAVYELKLFLNDEVIFHSKVDSFAYHQTKEMFLDRVYPILKKTRSGFQRLFIADGNTLPFYRTTSTNGKLNLPEGNHRLTIAARDYFGNESRAVVTLVVSSREYHTKPVFSMLPVSPADAPPLSCEEIARWQWFDNWITLSSGPGPSYFAKPVTGFGVPFLSRIIRPGQSFRLDEHYQLIIANEQGEWVQLNRIRPEQPQHIFSSDYKVQLQLSPHTFYDTLSVALTHREFRADSVRIDIYPDTHPVKNAFRLSYILNDRQMRDSTLALYSYNHRKGNLGYIPGVRQNRQLIASVEETGTYFLLSDTTAPAIKNPRIFRREDGNWVASVEVTDRRSGLNLRATEFRVNGVRGIAEYEPQNERLFYYHPAFEPSGQNIFEIIVEDRLGNRQEKTFEL